ncbi:hypothetical protein RRG08_012946 [Elysia crispata]|uniref:Uncharacterized protein n=1 Tax=Elysia crispata TaxID=231223 RepID=A0AAE1A0I0_9GAST|nr:hypothetical protein RRG08_012946 [Elysia crispata]
MCESGASPSISTFLNERPSTRPTLPVGTTGQRPTERGIGRAARHDTTSPAGAPCLMYWLHPALVLTKPAPTRFYSEDSCSSGNHAASCTGLDTIRLGSRGGQDVTDRLKIEIRAADHCTNWTLV